MAMVTVTRSGLAHPQAPPWARYGPPQADSTMCPPAEDVEGTGVPTSLQGGAGGSLCHTRWVRGQLPAWTHTGLPRRHSVNTGFD